MEGLGQHGFTGIPGRWKMFRLHRRPITIMIAPTEKGDQIARVNDRAYGHISERVDSASCGHSYPAAGRPPIRSDRRWVRADRRPSVWVRVQDAHERHPTWKRC